MKDDWKERLRTEGLKDSVYTEWLETLPEGYTVEDSLLLFEQAWVVPRSLQNNMLKMKHDSLVAGHWGIEKTIELVSRDFWWDSLKEDVREYIRSCVECQRNKAKRQKKYGNLLSLELPF